MAKELNEEKLRKELIKVYEAFVENPKDKKIHNQLIALDLYYASAMDLIKSKAIWEGIFQTTLIIQEKHPAGKDKIELAKKIIKDLKQEE